MSIDNKPHPPPPDNHPHDDSDESLASSPVGDHDHADNAPAGNPAAATNPTGQDGQQPKRKGGRKPVSRPPQDKNAWSWQYFAPSLISFPSGPVLLPCLACAIKHSPDYYPEAEDGQTLFV